MRRLFVAIKAPPLPEEVEERIDATLATLPGARRTGEDARHITLAFLGDVAQERIAEAKCLLQDAAQGARRIPYAFDRLGGFPGRTARVLALTGKTPPPLASLAADIGRGLRAAGLPADEKPLRLHLTVARLRTPAAMPAQEIDNVSSTAEEICLYESELLSAGAHYTVLEALPLSDALRERRGPESGEGGD